ncbi:MAG: gliding motility-associated C-terminal domain-containing protein [Cyclobacteriaceae bacterium]
MPRTSRLLTLLLALGSIFTPMQVEATHIRAGEIRAKRIDNLTFTYEFIFVGYRDRNSNIPFGNGSFDFGDGTTIEVQTTEFSVSQVSSTIERAEFRVIHTFDRVQSYIVSYREQDRNAGISNLLNSVNTPFYVEMLVVIDPFLGTNSSPILTVPPIDEGSPGVRFIHNPGAFDEDGDILTYEFVVPRQSKDEEVFGYVPLDDPQFYTDWSAGSEDGSPASLALLSDEGDLIWNSPGDIYRLGSLDCPEGAEECSEYSVAFRITEWRERGGRLERVGYVIRDMQIVVYEGDNEQPELQLPPEVCVTAGDVVDQTIIGLDPDGHQVKIEAFGGPFEVNSAATYRPVDNRFQTPPAALDFNWETVCGHVRDRPYEVQFKITDRPVENGQKVGPALVNFGTWEVSVVGPQPNALTVEANTGRSVELNWDAYTCTNAEAMQVWRRVGEFELNPGVCEVGIPAEAGYTQVGEVAIGEASFIDEDLSPGANYCYRLVAVYPAPAGGISYASEEVCLTLLSDAPIVTNVDVISTSTTDGSVKVVWTPPYDVDPVQFPPPYTYNLSRSNNASFDEGELVAENLTDTSFIDTGLNTRDIAYSYQIQLFDAGGDFVDVSASASVVRLNPTPLLSAIELQWTANVPWSNTVDSDPYHLIYRDLVGDDPTQLVLIDSVDVRQVGFKYVDDGRFNGVVLDDEVEYCYYVKTFGTYDNSPLLPEPLINSSQIICAQTDDLTPPCVPLNLKSSRASDCVSFLSSVGCNYTSYNNEFTWEPDFRGECEDDISQYYVYYSSTGLPEDFILLDSTTETSYNHLGLSSFKGSYQISAIDRSKNESARSNVLLFDNCPNFLLPNVFTPNGDGINDLFTPFYNGANQQIDGFDNNNCPRFVQDVQFEVFNRQGKRIFNLSEASEQSQLINWDGRTNAGVEVPAGTYFYIAYVTFDVLDPDEQEKEFRGWVQLMR